MGTYYVKTKRGGQAQGPFTADQLKTLAAEGKLKPHYLVSKDQDQWYVAGNVTDLPVAQGAAAVAKAARSVPSGKRPPAARHGAVAGASAFRFALTAGLAGALIAAAIVTAYFFFGPGGANDTDIDPYGPLSGNKALAKADADRPAAVKAAVTPPSKDRASPDRAATTTPAPDEAAAKARVPADTRPIVQPIVRPPPKPRPSTTPEPPAPPRSFEVLSAAYVGQEVKAMGSELEFSLTNRSGKGITSVKGRIRLYDPSGGYLVGLPVEINEPIEAGATVTKLDVWMTVRGTILGMLDASSKQMKFRFAAEQVAYEDGSTETFQ